MEEQKFYQENPSLIGPSGFKQIICEVDQYEKTIRFKKKD